jgi:hypothetical protein
VALTKVGWRVLLCAALCSTTILASAATADAFTRDWSKFANRNQFVNYGNFHSITYTRARTSFTASSLCTAMYTAAGNPRGGQNHCASRSSFSSVCFSTPTPMTNHYMIYNDTSVQTALLDGRMDNSTNHSGCLY